MHYFINLSLFGSFLIMTFLVGVLGFLIVFSVFAFIISFLFETSKKIFRMYISGFEL